MRRIPKYTPINSDFPYKETPSYARNGGRFYITIKTPKTPIDQGTHNLPQLWHSRVVRSFNLIFRGYLAGTTPVLSVRSSLFVLCRYYFENVRIVWLIGDSFFSIISLHHLWETVIRK